MVSNSVLVFFFIFSLAVELLILFAFRKSDTNSRSLDRMRKYFESKTKELDDLVGEKKLELDDIKKAMEGSEQNARDLIKSFESSFNMVRKRDEEIKVLSSQLDTFRNAFNDMADASLKADKNLQLLKQESRNVEIVRRSIQNLTSQQGEIKEQADSILAEFNKKNEEAFEQLRLNLLNTVNLNMGSLQDGLEMAGKRLETFNTQIEELTGRQALVSENAVKDLTIAMNTRLPADLKKPPYLLLFSQAMVVRMVDNRIYVLKNTTVNLEDGGNSSPLHELIRPCLCEDLRYLCLLLS